MRTKIVRKKGTKFGLELAIVGKRPTKEELIKRFSKLTWKRLDFLWDYHEDDELRTRQLAIIEERERLKEETEKEEE